MEELSMNYFKRALASVTRRKGKSIILFAVVFILGNVIAGSISIQQATKSVEKNIKSQLGGTATITMDYARYEKEIEQSGESEIDDKYFESVKLKEIETIGQLPYVKYYDYSIGDYPGTNKLKMYNSDPESMSFGGPAGVSNYLNLKGVNYPKVFDIEEKKIALKEGRVFEEAEIESGKAVALISTKFAETNNLKVGDTMVIDATGSNDMGMDMSSGEEDEEAKKVEVFVQDQPYEVIGIFNLVQQEKSKKKDDKNNMGGEQEYMDNEQYNTIYAPNKIIFENQKNYRAGLINKFPEMKEMYGEEESEPEDSKIDDYLTPYFVLKTPEDAEAFRTEATPLLANKYNKVLLSTDQYDSIAGPVKNMSKIANYVIIVSVAATLLIISLVVLLFLRDRKHELGVYLSLGEKRTKVIGQIVIEVAVIAFVAISLSVFTGNVLAKGVSGSLMETQMKAQEDNQNQGGYDDWQLQNLTGNQIGNSEVADSYKVSLSLGYIISFYIVGIGTVLLSTIIPLIYILRLNPKKIMM